MEQQQRQLVKKYLDILLRGKKIIILFLLLGLTLGLAQYLKSSKVYQSTALIEFQRQRINPERVSSADIQARTREVVATVSQQITSRSSLEALIKHFDLYVSMRSVLPMEDVVDVMRKNHITISPDRGNIFNVSYQGGDPKKVQLVTNALAAKFIEENLRYREERASETSTFIQDELRMARESLDKKEAVMRDYKLKYYNEMADQRPNNMNRLNALQEQYQNNQNSSQNLERTKVLVQEQISLRQELLAQQLNGTGMIPVVPGGMAGINELQRELQALEARYTEKHPEVRRVQKLLKELEAKQNKVTKEDVQEDTLEQETTPFVDPQAEQLKRQLNDMEYNIARLKKERQSIVQQIEKYQAWVDAAPVREAEWAGLTRDYGQLNQHYQALVAESLEAESAYSMEKKQKGSQFRIVDSAHFPEKPFKPDFRKIMLMAVGVGLGIGGAIALGLELLGTSFKDPAEVEAFLEVPVVCAVPRILTAREQSRKKIRQIIWTVVFVLSYTAFAAALIYFWKQGQIVL